MEPSTYPKQPNPPPPSEPQPSKAEGVPPPYSAPGMGFAGSQQVPQQQYGGQYNQGYQPGPSPVMYAGQQPMQHQSPMGPVSMQTVTVVAQNQGTVNQWYQSFCGCFDNFMICLATFCCPECVFFCIAYYTKLLKIWGISFCLMMVAFVGWILCYTILIASGTLDPNDPSVGAGLKTLYYFCYAMASGAGVARLVIFMAVRYQMRGMYNIRGTLVEDCFFSCCCSSCVTCQMMAEVDHQLDMQGQKTIFNRT
ncbi:uncharacterized protein LOC142341032 [Convolutriloba macropyga]|uniref:uncharacterized protein LOC142341032 n=1 Tax=Convolutriloba macropyga TaxID=536237 RepID=UPI003F51CFF3